MAIGNYTPPRDEYSRPPGQYLLEVATDGQYDRHYVRGAVYHQEALLDYQDGDKVLVELVPEPGNPHDPWAVAFHVAGRRIGYVAADFADGMHEYIAGHNRRGRAVLAQSQMRILEDKTLAVTALLPWWRDQKDFREESGIPAECRSLIFALPDDVRDSAIKTSQNLDPADAKRIRSLKRKAPHLVWSRKGGTQIPSAIQSELFTMNRVRIEARKESRAQEKELSRQAKSQAQEAKSQAKIELEEGIRGLARQGLTKISIARQLGCSETKVRSTLTAAGVSTTNANAVSRDERLTRARLALELQRGGLTRLNIARQLEYTIDTVKGLLKDAKFFEDPTSDLPRLDRALTVDTVSKTATLEEASSTLGWTAKAIKAARSDVAIFKSESQAQQ